MSLPANDSAESWLRWRGCMMRLRYRLGGPFLVSVALGLVTPAAIKAAGIGSMGAWLLMVILSLVLLCWIGGKYRAFFTGIATIVPFVYIFVEVIGLETRTYGSATRFLGEITREFLGHLFLLVLLPIFIAWRVTVRLSAKASE